MPPTLRSTSPRPDRYRSVSFRFFRGRSKSASCSASSAGSRPIRTLHRSGATQASHAAAAGGRAAHPAITGALHVTARVVLAVDHAVVAGPHAAAIHVVAREVAAIPAGGATSDRVVAVDRAVVAAAGVALLHV